MGRYAPIFYLKEFFMNEETNSNSIDNSYTIEDINENEVSNEVEYNSTTENTITYTEQQDNVITLQDIHNDFGIITSFLVFFVLVILLKYSYKFFNMFFVI